MTSFQTLRTDVSHRVATIWLNRPDAAPAATDPAGRIEPVLMRTPVIADAAEGVTAFLQKRAPQWPLSKVKDYPPVLSE
jgi:enoyl-CoA hydratase/carnithine racemase